MARAKKSTTNGPIDLRATLWAAADALRANMDAAEYKHVVLGLIFLKYISDAFEAKHAELDAQCKDGADPEDADEYRAVNIFWVPKEARWSLLKANAPQPTIGKTVDDAMEAIERDNPTLKGVLPKDYARPGLDKERLGGLFSTHSPNLSIRSTRRGDVSMDGPGFDMSARRVDVLDTSDQRASTRVLEKKGDTGRGTYCMLGRTPATNSTNAP